MNNNIKENNELYYSLGYPKVKAVRGSTRNQFFSLDDKGFLEEHSFTSLDLVNQSEVYRYFQFKNDEKKLYYYVKIKKKDSPKKKNFLHNKNIEKFKSNGNILTVFNKTLFTKSDSREPEVSGVLGAIIG